MKNNALVRINELEKISGVHRSTIHYYLKCGLLHRPVKTGKTMAYYNTSHLKRLLKIKKIQNDKRMPILFIKQQLENNKKPRASKNHIKKGPERIYSPREKKKRKRSIMDSAIKLFSQKGYHLTSVRNIAEEAGISVGAFYLYFTNKREIFIEIVDDITKTINEALKSDKTENMSFFEMTILRVRVFVENFNKYGNTFLQLAMEASANAPLLTKKIENVYEALVNPVIDEVHHAQNEGLLRKVDPELLVYTVMGICSIMAMRLKIDNKYSQEDIINSIFDLLMKGLDPKHK